MGRHEGEIRAAYVSVHSDSEGDGEGWGSHLTSATHLVLVGSHGGIAKGPAADQAAGQGWTGRMGDWNPSSEGQSVCRPGTPGTEGGDEGEEEMGVETEGDAAASGWAAATIERAGRARGGIGRPRRSGMHVVGYDVWMVTSRWTRGWSNPRGAAARTGAGIATGGSRR